MEREWNYYFEVGDEVMIDEYGSEYIEFCIFEIKNIKDRLLKKAIVKKCYYDLHSFGRGSMYVCEIEFEDGITITISASYLVKYIETCKTSQ